MKLSNSSILTLTTTMTSCMTLCEIQNRGLVLIHCLNNSTRENVIIPPQEETIPNLEILEISTLLIACHSMGLQV